MKPSTVDDVISMILVRFLCSVGAGLFIWLTLFFLDLRYGRGWAEIIVATICFCVVVILLKMALLPSYKDI